MCGIDRTFKILFSFEASFPIVSLLSLSHSDYKLYTYKGFEHLFNCVFTHVYDTCTVYRPEIIRLLSVLCAIYFIAHYCACFFWMSRVMTQDEERVKEFVAGECQQRRHLEVACVAK